MSEHERKVEEMRRRLLGKRQGGKLNNWRRWHYDSNNPEAFVILGRVENDDYWGNDDLRTSTVVKEHLDLGFVETLNTFYELGEKMSDEDLAYMNEIHKPEGSDHPIFT